MTTPINDSDAESVPVIRFYSGDPVEVYSPESDPDPDVEWISAVYVMQCGIFHMVRDCKKMPFLFEGNEIRKREST